MTSAVVAEPRIRGQYSAPDWRRLIERLSPVIAGVAIVLVWQLASVRGWLPSSLPAPWSLGEYLAKTVQQATFWSAVSSTMLSWVAGFGVSVVLGVALGAIAGVSDFFERLIRPVVEFCRPIPSVVYLPLVILVAGTGRGAVVFLVAGAALWPVLLQTMAGVRDTDPVLRDMTRAFGFTRWARIRWCTLPSAAPFIATGLRISATISLVVVITVELLGTGKGLGGMISTSYMTGSYVALFGISLAAAVIGLLLDQLLGLLEARVLHWHTSYRQGGLS